MLTHQTIDKLTALGLSAMAGSLAEQLASPGPWSELSFEERLGLLKASDHRYTDVVCYARKLGGGLGRNSVPAVYMCV